MADSTRNLGGAAPPPEQETAQTAASEPEYLIVAHITRPHGILGEVKAQIITQYPERLKKIRILYLGNEHRPLRLQDVRYVDQGLLLRFETISDRKAADLLRDTLVYIHRQDAVPLNEGEYYLYQLEGIDVVTDAGDTLGKVTGVIETGANDVYVVTRPDGSEILLPVIPDVILNVDTQSRRMTVHLLNGLV